MLTFTGTVGALCGVGFGAWAGAGTLAFVLSQSMYGSMVTACYCSKLSIPFYFVNIYGCMSPMLSTVSYTHLTLPTILLV